MSDEAVKKEPKAKSKPTNVVFYWRRWHSPRFLIKSGGKNLRYSAKNNILSLNPEKDADMIAYLRARADNEANGGVEFAELDVRQVEGSNLGAQMDKLYGMDTQALAALVGGGVKNSRKTKGELISMILELE